MFALILYFGRGEIKGRVNRPLFLLRNEVKKPIHRSWFQMDFLFHLLPLNRLLNTKPSAQQNPGGKLMLIFEIVCGLVTALQPY